MNWVAPDKKRAPESSSSFSALDEYSGVSIRFRSLKRYFQARDSYDPTPDIPVFGVRSKRWIPSQLFWGKIVVAGRRGGRGLRDRPESAERAL